MGPIKLLRIPGDRRGTGSVPPSEISIKALGSNLTIILASLDSARHLLCSTKLRYHFPVVTKARSFPFQGRIPRKFRSISNNHDQFRHHFNHGEQSDFPVHQPAFGSVPHLLNILSPNISAKVHTRAMDISFYTHMVLYACTIWSISPQEHRATCQIWSNCPSCSQYVLNQ
jgi:hypothetical protein